MSRRVVIQGGNAARPFRVGSPGVNADTADLFDLFFDGNQSPLRLWGTGYVSVPRIAGDNLAPALVVTGPAVVATPPGQFPVFIVNGRASHRNPGFDALTTAFHQIDGYGGVVANNTFYGINFSKEASPGANTLTDALVNYAVFRNYG